MIRVYPSMAMAERVSWSCALLLALMLVRSCCDTAETETAMAVKEMKMLKKPCDEIYVVREGETLQTIGDKCGDPYIVEKNPHIHDPDDVFPGMLIKITPLINR